MVFFGALTGPPTRRCDLVVPADWGWGRSNDEDEEDLKKQENCEL